MSVVSLIVPCFNEEQTMHVFYERADQFSKRVSSFDFEFVFVNDGSSDRTGEILNDLAAHDERVKVLHLAANRGHQIALTAGIDFATGDIVVTMDADLQDPPELIEEMIDRIQQGFDIVHAQRRRRAGETYFKRATASLFYRFMTLLVTPDLVQDAGDFRAFTRPVLQTARCFREPHRFLRGLFCSMGFRQAIVTYDRDPRYAGVTKYSFLKMVDLASNAVLNASTAPLRLITAAGTLMWCVSLTFILSELYQRLMNQAPMNTWLLLAAFIAFSSGLTLFGLNVLGAYIARIYEQGLRRPLYWLSDTRNVDPARNAALIGPSLESQLSLSILRSRALQHDHAFDSDTADTSN